MSFKAWMNRLRADGHLVCPTSSAVPVDVRSVRQDGVGLHFRCRGTAVRLAAYRPGRTAWQVSVHDEAWCPEEALQLWSHRPLESPPPPSGARLAFPGGQPDQVIVLDGARTYGWTSHEAGLLRPADAAPLFDRLAADLALDATTPPIRPATPARTEHRTLSLGGSPGITVPAARSTERQHLGVRT